MRKEVNEFKPIVRPMLLGQVKSGKIDTSELRERSKLVLGKIVLLFGSMSPDQLYKMGFIEAAKKLSKGAINHSYSEWEDREESYEEYEYIPMFKPEEENNNG